MIRKFCDSCGAEMDGQVTQWEGCPARNNVRVAIKITAEPQSVNEDICSTCLAHLIQLVAPVAGEPDGT